MRKYLFVFLLLTCILAHGRRFTVIDDSDGTGIQGATVIGKSGLILGITDASGSMEEPKAGQYPLSIRSIGYEASSIPVFSDTVRLSPAVYSLNEFVVNQHERPIKRVICFAREYATGATGSDTLQLYTEYMLDSFILEGDKKVKGYKSGDASPKIRNIRRYGRISSTGSDSIIRPKDNDDITLLSWKEILSVPDHKFRESDAISAGAASDTLMGKYSPADILRKQNGLYSITSDRMSQYKDHKWSPFFFKLLGMTMDVENMTYSLLYNVNDKGLYTIDDLVYVSYSIHLLAKGKIFKRIFRTDQPIDMDTYIELYPVSITYLSLEEYKEISSEKDEIPFQTSLNLQPLSEGIQSMVDREEGK